jgi:glutaredoxin 3
MMDQFTVYTQTDCLFCTKAIELLNQTNEVFTLISVRRNPYALAMMRTNGFKTVPQIYHGTHHVGGYEDLVRYMEEPIE